MGNIFDQLERDEGKVSHLYKDSTGHLTIGVGHNLDAKGLSDRAIRVILEDDVEDVRRELFQTIPWIVQLDEVRQGVLKNMAFNLGVPGLVKFKQTLAHIQAGAWEDAAADMLNSLWAKEVGPRATRLAKQLETGIWQ